MSAQQVEWLMEVARRLEKTGDYQNSNTVEEAAESFKAALGKLDATASALTAERAQKKEIGERLLAAETRLDKVQLEYEKYAGLCFACTPYLKEHETPAECIQRNRDDVTQMLGMLAKERKELEAARSRLSTALSELCLAMRHLGAEEKVIAEKINQIRGVERQSSNPPDYYDGNETICGRCGKTVFLGHQCE